MPLLNKNFLFISLWILVAIAFQFNKIMVQPPLGIHQGAQCDRASIARNYYAVNMNFFEPRVMETATKDGITPCEFPLVNYTVAGLYSLFGYSPIWYRLLMWLLMGLGLWAAFDMLCIWLLNKWAALLICFTWFFGSVLCFYTPNFLPDTASLALLLLALRQWYLYRIKPYKKHVFLFTLFAALAGLIKISSMIFIIALVFISFLEFIKNRRPSKLMISYIFIFGFVFSWYQYGQWLEQRVGGSYFLLNIAPPNTFNELKEWFHVFTANWFLQIFNLWQWLYIAIGVIAGFFIKEKLFWKWFAYLSLLGVIGFYLLMASQFRYHDYYSISLLPVGLIFMVFCFHLLFSIHKYLAFGLTLIVCILGFVDAKNNFRLRYTKGEYLNQTFFEPSQFVGTDDWLNKNGINQNTKILAAFDPNPNTLLYFLNRRGCRVFDHNLAYVNGKLKLYPYLITNNASKFFKQYPSLEKTLLLKSTYLNWTLYSVK